MRSKLTSIIWTISKSDLQLIIDKSNGYSEIIRNLGLCDRGSSNFRRLKDRLRQDGLTINHYNRAEQLQKFRISNGQKTLQEYLTKDSIYRSSTHNLKRRLIQAGLLENKCSCCGLTEWMGKPISLHLDHKNGITSDNTIENLRLLCPNCHSQTDTYAGKNKKYK